MTHDLKDEARNHNDEIMKLIRSMGGNTRKYRRERTKNIRAIVMELYSPPRVSAAARLYPGLGCIPGAALDLTVNNADGKPWDFDDPQMRAEAWEIIRRDEPALVITTPMWRSCAYVSACWSKS